MSEIELKDVIKYDPKVGNFVVASKDFTVKDVDELLAQIAAHGGVDARDQMLAIATTVVEPINTALPYKLIFTDFYQEVGIGDLEDPAFPVESQVYAIGFQVHPESEVFFVRPSLEWVRGEFDEWSAGVEMPWKLMRRTGWNVLARMMLRATDHIARQIDTQAKNTIDAAIVATAGQQTTQTQTTLQKATVDSLIKAAHTLGFPMSRGVINSGTVTDMVGWTTGVFNANLPEREAREMLQTLHLGEYGGCNWYSSPFVPTNYIYFSGQSNMTGWHLVRGTVTSSSDVDIRKGIDLHAIRSAEHSFYVQNAYNVRRIQMASA